LAPPGRLDLAPPPRSGDALNWPHPTFLAASSWPSLTAGQGRTSSLRSGRSTWTCGSSPGEIGSSRGRAQTRHPGHPPRVGPVEAVMTFRGIPVGPTQGVLVGPLQAVLTTGGSVLGDYLTLSPIRAHRVGSRLTVGRTGNPLTLCDNTIAVFVAPAGRSLWPPTLFRDPNGHRR
jgi:hypothetical protein